MQRIGLYYPYIHCRDEQWLKLTVLYWPKLARVVPEGYPVADSDTVAALNDGLGFLETTRPEPAASAIAPLFLNLLQEHRDALKAEHGVSRAPRESVQCHNRTERVMGAKREPWDAVAIQPRRASRRRGRA